MHKALLRWFGAGNNRRGQNRQRGGCKTAAACCLLPPSMYISTANGVAKLCKPLMAALVLYRPDLLHDAGVVQLVHRLLTSWVAAECGCSWCRRAGASANWHNHLRLLQQNCAGKSSQAAACACALLAHAPGRSKLCGNQDVVGGQGEEVLRGLGTVARGGL
jgi:hypothetical protein